MNQTFIDFALLALSLSGAITTALSMKKREAGILFSTLLLFPPLVIFLNMWAHTIAVSILYSRRLLAGSFQFTFTVYSHFLFGISFLFLSGTIIHCTKEYLKGVTREKKLILLLNSITFVLFFPVGFINPIGFLPVIAVIISTLTLSLHNPFCKRGISPGKSEDSVVSHKVHLLQQ